MCRWRFAEYIRKQCLSPFILETVYAFLPLRAGLYCNALPTQMQLNGTSDAQVLKNQWFYNIQGGFELPTQMQLNGNSKAKVLKKQWILNLQGGFELQLIANSNPTQRELKRKSIEKLMVFSSFTADLSSRDLGL